MSFITFVMLRVRLWRLRLKAQPSQQFLQTLEQKMLSKHDIHIMHRWRVLQYTGSVIAIIGCLFGGTVTYAYTSDAVLPDHSLYGLRRGVEGLESHMATMVGKPDMAREHLAHRRIRESRLLQERRVGK